VIRAQVDVRFWQGRRVLLTGHTGFKGSWLALWLVSMGASVTGFSLLPNTRPNLFTLARVGDLCESHFSDVRDYGTLKALVDRARPEIVFHCAAQPLVRESYMAPVDTFGTNFMGTVNLLEALRGASGLLAGVFVTTDKVYRNKEWQWAYRENDELGGHDPYSASKAASELAIASYRSSFFSKTGVPVASARAGNVIGGGDYSSDRLFPDAIRAWQSRQPLLVRRPHATRPWQHVLEALEGYLLLAAKLAQADSPKDTELCSAFNFGPTISSNVTVKDIVELARHAYVDASVMYEAPEDSLHESSFLSLDTAKARAYLGFKPHWSLEESVQRTIAWYRAVNQGKNARDLCERELLDYQTSFCQA
jgi:CDP-glucose 4,6-dehydratase